MGQLPCTKCFGIRKEVSLLLDIRSLLPILVYLEWLTTYYYIWTHTVFYFLRNAHRTLYNQGNHMFDGWCRRAKNFGPRVFVTVIMGKDAT